MRTCEPWKQEAIDAVGHGSRKHLGQRAMIISVGSPERSEVAGAVALVNKVTRLTYTVSWWVNLHRRRGAGKE